MRSAFLIGALCISSAFASNGSERMPVAPHQSVDQRFSAIRHNDIGAFMRTMLSDEQVADLTSKWDEKRAETPNEHETAKFAQTMQMLTAPGAEDVLMALLKPQLEEMRPQMQMMVGMFSGMISSGIQSDEDLTSEQKDKAAKLVTAVGTFLTENDLTDEKSAKKAVAVVCATARRLNLATMEELLALDFGQALQKGDVVMAGVKELFAVYGINFDDWIDHIKTETISQTDDKATVRVHYEIFGVKDSVDEELVRMGARWVSTKTAEAFSAK